ncbi:hypothetical protein ACFC18_53350, partial [Streptomyces sp. NPDC056121]
MAADPAPPTTHTPAVSPGVTPPGSAAPAAPSTTAPTSEPAPALISPASPAPGAPHTTSPSPDSAHGGPSVGILDTVPLTGWGRTAPTA